MEHLPRYLSSTIISLPNKFQQEDFIQHSQCRSRQLTLRSLLLTMTQLVGSAAQEGYDHALTKVLDLIERLVKSAKPVS